MDKLEYIKKRMHALGIDEDDIVENFIKGSGKGGQKINKTSSCVQIIHQKSGMIITCQKTRSQSKNRQLALIELCEKLENLKRQEIWMRRQEVEKERRKKRKRPYIAQQKILKEKRHIGAKKRDRRKPSIED